jgi:hypothetical protein
VSVLDPKTLCIPKKFKQQVVNKFFCIFQISWLSFEHFQSIFYLPQTISQTINVPEKERKKERKR